MRDLETLGVKVEAVSLPPIFTMVLFLFPAPKVLS